MKEDMRMFMAKHRRKILLAAALSSSLCLLAALIVAANFLAMFLEPLGSRSEDISHAAVQHQEEAGSIKVYVPGAGFSGFYYTLGRLAHFHNSPASPSSEYYCFSAGCLALVTSLLDLPVRSVIELAATSRGKWAAGKMSRYEVVQQFVDGLLSQHVGKEDVLPIGKMNATTETNTLDWRESGHMEFQANLPQSTTSGPLNCSLKSNTHNLHKYLPRINVITSAWDRQNLLSHHIQKPRSVEHLRRILVQTTWIPLVTGPSLGEIDDSTGLYHNDGAFAGLFQRFLSKSALHFRPSEHHHSLLLPWSLDLISNSLNLRLSRQKAVYFWREGFRRGV